MNKTQFNEALISLVEFASANANHVSKNDIELHFKDILTDESMYTAIYSYLKESKITIDDINDEDIPTFNATVTEIESVHEESSDSLNGENRSELPLGKTVAESEEELEFLSMYDADVKNITPLSDNEKEALVSSLKSGDTTAMGRLTEAYLGMVQKIATDFRNRGLTLGDLIQEGNIGLMMALAEFDKSASSLDDFLESKVRESIELALSTQINSERISSHLAERMNSLDNLSRDLTEKLGHAPSVQELAKEMNISEDEVDTIIRTSMNVLSVEQGDE